MATSVSDDTRPDVSTSHSNAPRKLFHIQNLRGIAATLVVLHHVLHPRPWSFSPLGEINLGRPGVLIFFVISGFIMAFACGSEPIRTFARRRVIRIVPLYWLMTVVFFAFIARNDLMSGTPFERVPELLQSLFFIPHFHRGVPDEIWPILVPGWTLNYEAFFFVIFAVGIVARSTYVLPVVLLLSLVALGAISPSDNAIFLTWTNPFLLLFAAGLTLARLFQGGGLPSRCAWLLLPGTFLMLAGAVAPGEPIWQAPLFFVAAVLIVAGVLGLEVSHFRAPHALLLRIGDASYSIYLSHTIILIPLMALFRQLPLTGWPQFLTITIGASVICIWLGILVWRHIEMPLIQMFRNHQTAATPA
ncbi:acyltransferase family protein [Alloyangia pacifica]|uniref:acyltransferase family protein n=1 Tax=Alloyangia pacifica TaxID=311180 RepID=UPI001CD61958|nr:acyltransferase [Alloyangia pacifica]MCA0994799.1 acyltransferase [Alloyangia pacifica]